VGDKTEDAVLIATRCWNGRQTTRVIHQLVVSLAKRTGGCAGAFNAVGSAGRAGKNGGIEVKVGGCALIANGVVEAELAAVLAGLAGQPGKGDVECPLRALGVAVGLVVVVLAPLSAAAGGLVPAQAAQLGIVVVVGLAEQRIARVEVDAGIADQVVGVDAGKAVGGVPRADVAANRAGEAQPRR
jgi:hypothetical protein